MNDVAKSLSYNKIYQVLVDDDPTLDGMVAYCYYKTSKREWVMDFWGREGRSPSEAEMAAYTATWTSSRLEGLMTQAEKALAEYASEVITNERPKIMAEALKEKSFLRDLFIAFLGAALWTFFLIVLAFILKYAHIDLISIFHSVGKDG